MIFLSGGGPSPAYAASRKRPGTTTPGATPNRPTFDDESAAAPPTGGVQEPVKVQWGRLGFAALFLFGILAVGVATAIYHLDAWSTALLHSFETLTGVAVGLLGGEAASKLG